ncbi:MAG TPA: MFS transporter [Steroidobacteraceae bacterium]|nr:MFS transporter [Steroidobacteraceae bacterium]
MLLLAAVLFLNYVDRGALPTALPLLRGDMHLNENQLGLLISAFFWIYAPMQIPVGWLAERYGAHRVLAAGLTLWASSTMLVGVAHGFATLLVLRWMLGLGESAGFPCMSKILAASVPLGSLGTANGIVAFGYLMGPAVGIYLGGLLIEGFGWRVMFVVFGAVSLLWLLPWSRVAVRQNTPEAKPSEGPGTSAMLRTRELWGTSLGHFCSNYTFYFMLSWLPYYLVTERGFSNLEMSRFASSAFLVNALCAMAGGWWIDRLVKRGISADLAYKGVLGSAALVAVACMLCVALVPGPLALACIFIYQALCGASSPGVFAVPQILAGPGAAGRWVGIQNSIGNLAGIVAPWLTGFVVYRTGHFFMAFIVAAAVSVLGFVGWVFMVPRVRLLDWTSATDSACSVGARHNAE